MKPETTTCECGTTVHQVKTGRPRKHCDDCKRKSKAAYQAAYWLRRKAAKEQAAL